MHNTAKHPTDLQLGDDETYLIVCPDCAQMELWTEDERIDHGLCRTAGQPCPLCEED